jgi:hypothetical protein
MRQSRKPCKARPHRPKLDTNVLSGEFFNSISQSATFSASKIISALAPKADVITAIDRGLHFAREWEPSKASGAFIAKDYGLGVVFLRKYCFRLSEKPV